MATDPSENAPLSKADLRNIAMYQKIVVLCVGVLILFMIGTIGLPAELRALAGFSVLGVDLVAAIFVFFLAIKLYKPVVGVLLALLTLVPCIGLIMLLIINGKATGVLTKHGYKVGFFGASLSQFDN